MECIKQQKYLAFYLRKIIFSFFPDVQERIQKHTNVGIFSTIALNKSEPDIFD